MTCRKIPKISPGVCIFQRPFLRGLFLELLIFGGAYVRREVCVSKSNGLAYIVGRKFTVFGLFYFVSEGNFPSTSPGGAYIRRGDFTEGYCVTSLGGAYTWRGLFSEFYGSFSMGFKYGRIPVISNVYLLEF